MADKITLQSTDDGSNLMSFDSPAVRAVFLVPERTECQKSSPLLTVKKNATMSDESPDMNIIVTPVDASTPFTKNHVPKFVFPSPNPIQEQVSDPFDFVEQRADQMANDPFEMVSAEAAKIIHPIESSVLNETNSMDENEKTDSLNKAFMKVSIEHKTTKSNDMIQGSTSETVKIPEINISEPAQPSVKADDIEDEDLDNISPPWEGTGAMSDSDYDEDDLIEVVRNASMELMSSFTCAESLHNDNVRELELSIPTHLSCLLNESSPLALEVPPLSLDTSVLSSPLFKTPENHVTPPREHLSDSPFELCGWKEYRAFQGKLLTPRIAAKPLEMITNSAAAVSKTPAKALELLANSAAVNKLPTKPLEVITKSTAVGITPAKALELLANSAAVSKLPTKPLEVITNSPAVGITPAKALELLANSAAVSKVPTKPLEMITNSAAVNKTPAKPLEVLPNTSAVSKIPARLASRLMQPRIFRNKENI